MHNAPPPQPSHQPMDRPHLWCAARQVGTPGQLGGCKANEGGHVDAHAAVPQPRYQVIKCRAVLALRWEGPWEGRRCRLSIAGWPVPCPPACLKFAAACALSRRDRPRSIACKYRKHWCNHQAKLRQQAGPTCVAGCANTAQLSVPQHWSLQKSVAAAMKAAGWPPVSRHTSCGGRDGRRHHVRRSWLTSQAAGQDF